MKSIMSTEGTIELAEMPDVGRFPSQRRAGAFSPGATIKATSLSKSSISFDSSSILALLTAQIYVQGNLSVTKGLCAVRIRQGALNGLRNTLELPFDPILRSLSVLFSRRRP